MSPKVTCAWSRTIFIERKPWKWPGFFRLTLGKIGAVIRVFTPAHDFNLQYSFAGACKGITAEGGQVGGDGVPQCKRQGCCFPGCVQAEADPCRAGSCRSSCISQQPGSPCKRCPEEVAQILEASVNGCPLRGRRATMEGTQPEATRAADPEDRRWLIWQRQLIAAFGVNAHGQDAVSSLSSSLLQQACRWGLANSF